ncbi:MAG: hypothetical protein AAF530_16915 [Pseudomonadota bacterium]
MAQNAELEQLPEIIHIDGVLHTLYTTPLLPWLRQQDTPLVFDRKTPKCERGYVGRWEIREEMLWLTGVFGWQDGEYTGLSELFGVKDEIAADWFSGPLVVEPASSEIPDGARPEVRTLFVKEGRLVKD